MQQRGRELHIWEELVKKAVDAEAKAGLRLTYYVRETDQRCLRGIRPAHTTTAKAQTQGSSSMRDLRVEEPKYKP